MEELKGKCPIDNRGNRCVYIIMNNERVLVVTDGLGNAYSVYGEGYDAYDSKCLPENLINPNDYEFERGLSGMDY